MENNDFINKLAKLIHGEEQDLENILKKLTMEEIDFLICKSSDYYNEIASKLKLSEIRISRINTSVNKNDYFGGF